MAARMESNGERNRIHCSLETAQLLEHAGKAAWIQSRETLIHAKGKGTLQTYWVDFAKRSASNQSLESGEETTNRETESGVVIGTLRDERVDDTNQNCDEWEQGGQDVFGQIGQPRMLAVSTGDGGESSHASSVGSRHRERNPAISHETGSGLLEL
jgi:Adenylate and Guanylate cyclase catalytic domain